MDQQAHQFYPLVQINCSKDLRFLLCSIYTPICIHGYPHFLPPCRSVCERVRAGCAPIMQHYEFPWPERMNCDQFPEHNNPEGILCMERNLTREELESSKGFETPELSTTPRDVNSQSNLNLARESVFPEINAKTDRQDQSVPTPFDREASRILMEFSLKDPQVEQMMLSNPNLNLKCTCGCQPPLIRVDNSRKKTDQENISVAGIQDCAMPCRSFHFPWNLADKFTVYWLATWSALCALSTLMTLLTFITDSGRFQYPELPIIYLSICHLLIALGYLIRIFVGHDSMACETVPSLVDPDLSSLHEMDSFPADLIQELDHLSWGNLLPMTSNQTTSELSRLKSLRYASTGKTQCAIVFLLVYYFSMASSVWWVVLTFTWLLAAGLKWGSEAISKYSQVFHFVAWSTPACQTALAFLLTNIQGHPVSGLCELSASDKWPFILNLFLPMLVYLVLGSIFLVTGFIALFRIRDVIKLQRSSLVKTNKLEKLMIRIGIFGMVYIVPNITILFCLGYELRDTKVWQLGLACSCQFENYKGQDLLEWKPPKPEYALFMLKYFMCLMIGITSGFWIWSNKTVQQWKRLCCYSTHYCSVKFRKHHSHTGLLSSHTNPLTNHLNLNHLCDPVAKFYHLQQDQTNSNKYDFELWKQLSSTTSSGQVSRRCGQPIVDTVRVGRRTECYAPNSATPMEFQVPESGPFGFHSYDVVVPNSNNSQAIGPTPVSGTYYSIHEPTTGRITNVRPYQTMTSGMSNTTHPSPQTQSSSFNPGFSTLSSLSSPNKSTMKPTSGSSITRLSSSGIGSIPNDAMTRTGSMFTGSDQHEDSGHWSRHGYVVDFQGKYPQTELESDGKFDL